MSLVERPGYEEYSRKKYEKVVPPRDWRERK
jgi:hypothetical protein